MTIGGCGFTIASFSSYYGKDLLPIGHPSTLIFLPQGLIMGLYGIAAIFLSIYLWTLIVINFGAGNNRFDKRKGLITITRKGFLKTIMLEMPIDQVQSVKLESKDGINPKRKISLRVKGKPEIPLTGPGSPVPLIELEKDGAELARFLGVNLEGL